MITLSRINEICIIRKKIELFSFAKYLQLQYDPLHPW